LVFEGQKAHLVISAAENNRENILTSLNCRLGQKLPPNYLLISPANCIETRINFVSIQFHEPSLFLYKPSSQAIFSTPQFRSGGLGARMSKR
jgi:hypothetical protein